MKSAYELAMERLEKENPTQKLDPEQKAALAEVDKKYQAKIAERETFLGSKIESAVREGNEVEADALRDELAKDVQSLRQDWDQEKNRLRESFV